VVMDAGGGGEELGLLGGGSSRLLKHGRGNTAGAGGEEHGWAPEGRAPSAARVPAAITAASSMPGSRACHRMAGLRQLARQRSSRSDATQGSGAAPGPSEVNLMEAGDWCAVLGPHSGSATAQQAVQGRPHRRLRPRCATACSVREPSKLFADFFYFLILFNLIY
jgi:hypothetical protein